MGLHNLTNVTLSQVSTQEFFLTVQPLLIFILGVALYAVFIFKFYHYIARPDILKLNLSTHAEGLTGVVAFFFKWLLHALEVLVLIPVLIVFWFGFLALLLTLLADHGDLSTILLTTGSLVGAIRIAAYYNEDLAQDLAKMMPLALLGVLLVDIAFFSLPEVIQSLEQIPLVAKELLFYLAFIVLLEFTLRLLRTVYVLVIGKNQKD